MQSGLTLVTPAGSEPVTLAEAKLFGKIDVTDDDALITDLIAGARKALEERWDWSFVTQTWDYFLDTFPWESWAFPPGGGDPLLRPMQGIQLVGGAPILLPRQPIQSVTSVKYTDYLGVQSTVSSGDYTADVTNNRQPRIVPNIGKSWPVVTLQVLNAVVVRFVSGYGAASAVPEQAKLTIKKLVNYWYYNRENAGTFPAWVDMDLESLRSGFAYA
jgi:hypothetical protein